MAAFSFTVQTSGMIKMTATGTTYQIDQPERSISPSRVKEITLTPDGKKVKIILDDNSHYTIDPVLDSVVLGGTTIAANTYQTGAALKAQFDSSTVFKKANSGSGGSGVDGEDGRGITDVAIDGNGDLIITYSDATTDNAGHVVGANGTNGTSPDLSALASNIIPDANNIRTLGNSSNRFLEVWASKFTTGGSLQLVSVNTSSAITFLQGTTERARIAATTGNALIGTTTDDTTNKLQVSGNVKANQFVLPSTTIPSPASGQAIIWNDGTNVKITKNVGGTTTTQILF